VGDWYLSVVIFPLRLDDVGMAHPGSSAPGRDEISMGGYVSLEHDRSTAGE